MGQLVSPGTQVLSLVENTIWVQANYKETQLTNVTKGDAAEVTIDTFPGVALKGHVEEIAPASGSQFALLPPDNATGNYTKIAQRIPVKIVLDPNLSVADRLRAGAEQAQQRAVVVIGGQVKVQAYALAYSDGYIAIAVVAAFAIILIALMRPMKIYFDEG